MSRCYYKGITRSGSGSVIFEATISVYLSGTTTPASIYTSSSGGVAVNSVISSSTDASFEFWIDRSDYSVSQQFKIIISKTGYQSITIDNITIFNQHDFLGFVTPEMFGAKADGLVDCTTYIQDAIAVGNIVQLSAGTYKITSSILINKPIIFRGVGGIGKTYAAVDLPTRIHYTGTDYAIKVATTTSTAGVHLSDFGCTGTAEASGCLLLGTAPNAVQESTFKNILIRDFSKLGAHSWVLDYGVNNYLENVISTANYNGRWIGSGSSIPTTLITKGCRDYGNTYIGGYVTKISNWSMIGDIFDSNGSFGLYYYADGGGGILGDYMSGINMSQVYFENNGTTDALCHAEMISDGSGNGRPSHVTIDGVKFGGLTNTTYGIQLTKGNCWSMRGVERTKLSDIYIGADTSYNQLLDENDNAGQYKIAGNTTGGLYYTIRSKDIWDIGSTDVDDSQDTTITVTDASPGDIVTVSHDKVIYAGEYLTGVVSASDTVVVTYWNKSVATRTPGSGTLSVIVKKP
jgi:hypothetical protein